MDMVEQPVQAPATSAFASRRRSREAPAHGAQQKEEESLHRIVLRTQNQRR